MNYELFMGEALAEARQAAGRGAPAVGAIAVMNDAMVARGSNRVAEGSDPTAHAVMAALREAARKLGNYRLTGLTLVVTLEPCAMCAGAISHARIGRLVFGAEDPKGGAVVNGPRFFEQPTCHSRPAVTGGVLADESSALLKGFFRARRER